MSWDDEAWQLSWIERAVAIVIVGVLMFFAGIAVGTNTTRGELRSEAVRAGAAQWASDSHGNPVFIWQPASAATTDVSKQPTETR